MLALRASAAALVLVLTLPALAAQEPRTLELATWNLEWLLSPRAFRELRDSCVPRGTAISSRERRIPCDVAARLERSASDFAALARYARELDADVIALQEVDGAEAARLVFREHEFCFTGRRHVQNNGFAVRRGLSFRCGTDVNGLALGDRVRRGAELVLFPGEPREIRLLAVHLKSGCGQRLLDDPKRDCALLARQVPELERWIDAQALAGRRFAVLGDFNRDLLRDRGSARSASGRLQRLWSEIDDGDPPGADLLNALDRQRFLNCAPHQAHAGYIDYIVLGRTLGERLVAGSFRRLTWRPKEARRLRLPDHCPVAVTLRLD